MNEILVVARAVAARPLAALTVGYLVANFVATFVFTYRREHAAIVAEIDKRAEFVRSIADTIRAEEHNAEHAITDAEIADRVASDA